MYLLQYGENYIYNISPSLGLLVDMFTSHLNSGDCHALCKAITLGGVSYLDGVGESLSSSSWTPLREGEKWRSTVLSLFYIHVTTHMYLLQYGENYIYNISLGFLVGTFTSHLNSGGCHALWKAITLGSVSSYLNGEGKSLSSSSWTPVRGGEKGKSTVSLSLFLSLLLFIFNPFQQFGSPSSSSVTSGSTVVWRG